MPSVFHAAHIVCLPSYYREGLPKVLLEAAACGRPLVTTDAPGCRDVVQDGDNGILVPPRDARSLAQAIRRLIEDERLRLAMGKQAREIVLKEFSSEQVVRETIGVYRELRASLIAPSNPH
jgi:glycosyltransferase involved in cell wall biosynthesis